MRFRAEMNRQCLVIVWLLVCGHGAYPATMDSITVDLSSNLGPITYAGSGFLHSFSSSTPGANMLEAVKPRLFRATSSRIMDAYSRCMAMGCSVQVVMSDSWGYRDNCPGEGGDWATYENFVANMVNDFRSRGMHVQFDVWNEPDEGRFWSCDQQRFFDTWNHAYRRIKAIDPNTTVVGPSLCWDTNKAYLFAFLMQCKRNNTLPDVVSWHELDWNAQGKHIYQNIVKVRAFMADSGIGVQRIQINEVTGPEPYMWKAGITFAHLAQIERARIEGAAHACWDDDGQNNCFNNTLDGLITRAGEPRSTWWMYKVYADVTGNSIEVVPTTRTQGVVGVDVQKQEIRGVFGRFDNGYTGDVNVKMTNLAATGFLQSAGTALISASRIIDSDRFPSPGPVPLIRSFVPYQAGALTVAVPGISGIDGFTVEVAPVAGGLVPSFTMSSSRGSVPLEVGFDASGSTSNGTISSCSWNFGDASGGSNTATGATSAHAFTRPGVYTVRLTVGDNSGTTQYVERKVQALGCDAGYLFTSQTPVGYATGVLRYDLGTRFSPNCNGQISRVRVYTGSSESGGREVRLWRASDRTLISGPHTWTPSSSQGWKQFTLPARVAVEAGVGYVVSVTATADKLYAVSFGGFAAPIVNAGLVTYAGSGVFSPSVGSCPATVTGDANYFRDVYFEPGPIAGSPRLIGKRGASPRVRITPLSVRVMSPGSWKVSAVNSQGRTVLSSHLAGPGVVDLQGLAAGMYSVALSSGTHTLSSRVVRTR